MGYDFRLNTFKYDIDRFSTKEIYDLLVSILSRFSFLIFFQKNDPQGLIKFSASYPKVFLPKYTYSGFNKTSKTLVLVIERNEGIYHKKSSYKIAA